MKKESFFLSFFIFSVPLAKSGKTVIIMYI